MSPVILQAESGGVPSPVVPATLGRVKVVATMQPVTSGQPDSEYGRGVWSDNGADWFTLRHYERVDAEPGMAVTMYDYEPPPGKQRLYAAHAGRTLSGADILGIRSSAVAATLTLADWRLKVLDDPTMNMVLPVVNESGELAWTRTTQGAEHWPIGEQPFTSTTGVRNMRPTIPLLLTDDEMYEFDRIYNLETVVLLQSPRRQWYGEFGLTVGGTTLVGGKHQLEVEFSERARP